MIWLTWRQFRAQAVTAAVGLAVIAAVTGWLGRRIRVTYTTSVECAGCSVDNARSTFEGLYFDKLLLLGFLVVLVPVVIGAFWGAPLIARELEAGTHRLVWNQSVTRKRWLSVKLGLVALAGVVVTGVLSVLLTWAASPYDKVMGGRFDALLFPTRNVAPLGYAVFAVVLGAVVGLLARRTIVAMAITFAAVIGLQVLVPSLIRPHYQAPVAESVQYTRESSSSTRMQISPEEIRIEGYAKPGAWVLPTDSRMLLADGTPVGPTQIEGCMKGGPKETDACIAALNVHFNTKYQPADRYWTFQWIETAGYLLLAGLLAGFAFWRIPRGLS